MFVLLPATSNALAAEWTNEATVGEVQYTTITQIAYVRRADSGNWTGNGCSWVMVQLDSRFPGAKEFLAVVLTAEASTAPVKFFGDCNTSLQDEIEALSEGGDARLRQRSP